MPGQCSGSAFLFTRYSFNFIRTGFSNDLPTHPSLNADPAAPLDMDSVSIWLSARLLGTLLLPPMNTPTPLSPAAQAGQLILSYRRAADEVPHSLGLAAALRAVVDQAAPEPADCGPASHDYNKGAEDRQRLVRFRLLAIAAELEGDHA